MAELEKDGANERERDGEIGRKVFHQLFFFLNAASGWKWARLKLRAKSFTWFLHMRAGVQALGQCLAVFSDILARS